MSTGRRGRGGGDRGGRGGSTPFRGSKPRGNFNGTRSNSENETATMSTWKRGQNGGPRGGTQRGGPNTRGGDHNTRDSSRGRGGRLYESHPIPKTNRIADRTKGGRGTRELEDSDHRIDASPNTRQAEDYCQWIPAPRIILTMSISRNTSHTFSPAIKNTTPHPDQEYQARLNFVSTHIPQRLEKYQHTLQLRKDRPHRRAQLIKEGRMNPDGPMQLSEAVKLVGICTDMCPEYERVRRIVEDDVKAPECVCSPPSYLD